MTAIALALTIIVAAIGILHAYWAAGGLWPGTSPAELSNIVVGNPRARDMPAPRLTALVTAMIAGVAAWPLLLSPLVSRHLAPELAAAGTWAIAAVFLLRGVAGLTPWMAKRHAAEPFASYNRKYYSPLCLALGAGFLILATQGGTP
jgi:hypothetical protein